MTDNVYEKARQVLRERGWRRLGASDDSPGVCLLGALSVARGRPAQEWDLVGRDLELTAPVRAVIEAQFPDADVAGHPAHVPWKFNDHPGVTADDVDLVLDKAARAYDEQVQL